jgi:DNA polymerase III delta subunit
MSNYAQWRSSVDKNEIRRITWVCGDQPVLVEEVVDTIRDQLKATDLDHVSLTAGDDPDRTIWAAANQYPLVPGANRLILVRQAEKVRRWEPLEEWLANSRRLPNSYLVFVSGEPDVPYTMVEGKRVPKPWIELMRPPRGHVVRCGMPREADAIAWTKRRAPLDDEMAKYLLMRAGGNLALVASVCAKLALFDTKGVPGPRVIDELCREVPADEFVESLLMGRKRDALLATQGMDERDYRRVVATLDHRLDLLSTLNRAVRSGQSQRELGNVSQFLVRQYWLAAKHYDDRRCLYKRQVLAVVDSALRNGARDAVLEALVALW